MVNTIVQAGQLVVIMAILLIPSFTCREMPSPAESSSITLTAEDVGVTAVFVHLRAALSYGPYTMAIIRHSDDSTFAIYRTPGEVNASTFDTLVLDDSLLPNHSYSYKAFYQIGNVAVDSSPPLVLTTMDTTSHDFHWETDTLGDGASSVLRDVCIINDTCIYAVGEIHKRDSAGSFESEPYNAARWNGKIWKLLRIPTRIWSTNSFMTAPLYAVYAFSPNDVCVTTGGQVIWYDGETWGNWQFLFASLSDTTFGSTNKLWGIDRSQLWAVGVKGNIRQFNGANWTKMESGTDVDLLDVWGTPDGKTVFACGWEDFKPTILLRFRDGVWEKTWEDVHPFTLHVDSLSGILTSLYTSDQKRISILTDLGLYSAETNTLGKAQRIPFPATWSGFPWRVRGNARNDLVVAGEYYTLGHFNGVTFRHYSQLRGYGRLRSVDQKGNLIVAVGEIFDPANSRGIAFIGRR